MKSPVVELVILFVSSLLPDNTVLVPNTIRLSLISTLLDEIIYIVLSSSVITPLTATGRSSTEFTTTTFPPPEMSDAEITIEPLL